MTTLDSGQSLFSAESYFGTQLPPPTLDHDIAGVRSFVHRQRDLNRKVVLVTVSVAPILLLSAQCPCQERWDDCPVGTQCVSVYRTLCSGLNLCDTLRVRFLDNFSAGGSAPNASIALDA